MSTESKLPNVIFDFGGVLFAIDYHLPVAAFKALGFENFDAIYTQAAQNEIFDKLETGKISNEEFYQYLHSFCPAEVTREQVVEAWDSILLHLMPEKVAFVKSLRDAGHRTFMLSNTNAIHVAAFEKMIDESMGLAAFYEAFEKIHYSNVLGIKKPYPSTYLEVCRLHGLNPSETIFIDDSKQHVEGAAKAGLRAIHLLPGEEVDVVINDYIAKHF